MKIAGKTLVCLVEAVSFQPPEVFRKGFLGKRLLSTLPSRVVGCPCRPRAPERAGVSMVRFGVGYGLGGGSMWVLTLQLTTSRI